MCGCEHASRRHWLAPLWCWCWSPANARAIGVRIVETRSALCAEIARPEKAVDGCSLGMLGMTGHDWA